MGSWLICLYISYFERRVLLDVIQKLVAKVLVIQMQHRLFMFITKRKKISVMTALALQHNNLTDL
jgi:hypothetical protein